MAGCPDPKLLGTATDATLASLWQVTRRTIIRWREARGIPAFGGSAEPESPVRLVPDVDDDQAVLALGRVEYLELQLKELRKAERLVTGVALSQLKRQEREVYDELEEARKAERLKAEQESRKKVSPDLLLQQAILPKILKMSRPHREAIYIAIGVTLGIDPETERQAG